MQLSEEFIVRRSIRKTRAYEERSSFASHVKKLAVAAHGQHGSDLCRDGKQYQRKYDKGIRQWSHFTSWTAQNTKRGDITAEIKWVKLTTDMFDNKKIKQIRHLPEGNNIVLIWVMLLTVAGRCNAGGMIFLTENIPYTIESLAIELDFDQTVVKLALDVLQKFGMIVCDENAFLICGWDEHQNIEGMEKIREQNRLRKQAQREREKHLLFENSTVSRDNHVTSQQSHATDKEIELDKELEEDKELKSVYADKPPRTRFTAPTVEDVRAYCLEKGYHIDADRFVDYYTSNGWMVGRTHMKDWKAAVRTWARKDSKEDKKTNNIFLQMLEDEYGQNTDNFNPFGS